MKKKIVSLLLIVMTVLALMLTGCGEGEINLVDSTRTATTLTMWIITEDETTKTAIKEVEAAFNEVTQEDYTTRVDFVFCTADEYKAKLQKKFEKIDSKPAGAKNPNIQLSNTTYRDEDGMRHVYYADPWEYQMDILLVTDYEMLYDLVLNDRVHDLTALLNADNKIIKTYVNNSIMDNATVLDAYYAVPNNNIIGDYTFLLVNKELAEDYYFDPATFTSFGVNTPASQLIEEVARAVENGELTGVSPMYGQADYPLVKYWSQNSDAASVMATMYASSNMEVGAGVKVGNLFSDSGYKSFMQQMTYCKENGYMMDEENPTDRFAVGVIEGDYSCFQKYGKDYHVIPLSYPRLEDTTVFSSMFAVSTATVSLDRSMEIIQALTCESELRNILQYGVEGVHYELNDDGVVERLNNNYMMNINYTGNAFKAYPEEGMPADFWENVAIKQNLQSMLSIVFGTNEYMDKVDEDAWAKMTEVSLSYFDRLAKCKTVAELNAFMQVAEAEVSSSDYYAKLSVALDEDGKYNLTALNGAVQSWWFENYGANS